MFEQHPDDAQKRIDPVNPGDEVIRHAEETACVQAVVGCGELGAQVYKLDAEGGEEVGDQLPFTGGGAAEARRC